MKACIAFIAASGIQDFLIYFFCTKQNKSGKMDLTWLIKCRVSSCNHYHSKQNAAVTNVLMVIELVDITWHFCPLLPQHCQAQGVVTTSLHCRQSAEALPSWMRDSPGRAQVRKCALFHLTSNCRAILLTCGMFISVLINIEDWNTHSSVQKNNNNNPEF